MSSDEDGDFKFDLVQLHLKDKNVSDIIRSLLKALSKKEKSTAKEHRMLEYGKNVWEEKVKYLEMDIKTYKHEVASLQDELKTEKERANLYKNKFLDVQRSLLETHKRLTREMKKKYTQEKINKLKNLQQQQSLPSSSSSIANNPMKYHPFAIRPSLSSNQKRVVLAQDTCNYHVPETMPLVASPPQLAAAVAMTPSPASRMPAPANDTMEEVTSPQLVEDSDDAGAKRPFDPDETRLPPGGGLGGCHGDETDDDDDSLLLSIPATPQRRKRALLHEDSSSNDASPSLLPGKTCWANRRNKRKVIIKTEVEESDDGGQVEKRRKVEDNKKKTSNEEACTSATSNHRGDKKNSGMCTKLELSPIKPLKNIVGRAQGEPEGDDELERSHDEQDEKVCESWAEIFDKTEGVLQNTTQMIGEEDEDDERSKREAVDTDENEKNPKDKAEDRASNKKGGDSPNDKKTDKIPFKYDTVVRGKAEREKLEGKECPQCEAYYSDLTAEEKAEKLKTVCRHKKVFHPPSTPECYWELGIPDTEECVRRGYITHETSQMATRNVRTGRRRPYKANFPTKIDRQNKS